MGCTAAKEPYLELRARVMAQLAAADPVGLLAEGGVAADYDVEGTRITAALVRATTAEALAHDIHAILTASFGAALAGEVDAHAPLAAALLALPRAAAV